MLPDLETVEAASMIFPETEEDEQHFLICREQRSLKVRQGDRDFALTLRRRRAGSVAEVLVGPLLWLRLSVLPRETSRPLELRCL